MTWICVERKYKYIYFLIEILTFTCLRKKLFFVLLQKYQKSLVEFTYRKSIVIPENRDFSFCHLQNSLIQHANLFNLGVQLY